MMRLSRRQWFPIVAAGVLWSAFLQTGRLAAQTSGVGGDGFTRVLWRAADGSMGLWKLDANLSATNLQGAGYPQVVYGPYAGYTPIAIAVQPTTSHTYALWRFSDGSVSIWRLDPNLILLQFQTYGPFSGWAAETLSTDPSTGNLRLTWRATDGSLALWALDQNLKEVNAVSFQAPGGWDSGPAGP